ncbi:MAG: hypothetical protein IGS50_22515 [Synechococcales cyanobacterium C42_A2020_086]|nr:hypothetical protein [Synechococcales cyanobacterium C42_A2020_086]
MPPPPSLWSASSSAAGKPWLLNKLPWLKRLKPHPVSADYQAWRHQFMLERLHLAMWVAIVISLTSAAISLHIVLAEIERFTRDVVQFYGDSALAVQFRNATIVSCISTGVLLATYCSLQHLPAVRRYPVILFLALSLLSTLNDLIVRALFGIPSTPSQVIFLLQAVLIPVHWRLHLVSQVIPIAFSFGVLPLVGITHIGTRAFYDSYLLGEINSLFWVCLVCNVAVFLYERLKQSEFEARRQLQVFLHSVTHDLQTPVMGTLVVLQRLLNNPEAEILVKRSVLERLQSGSDRQLSLIRALLEAHTTEVQGIILHREPLHLKPIVDSVLCDLQQALTHNQVQLTQSVPDDLPLLYADRHQLWRVFSNLISNALKHNPNGIQLSLTASVVESAPAPRQIPNRTRLEHPPIVKSAGHPVLLCTVQDNGTGIPPQQCHRLFELYARGPRARYMPGLGLGLYLCKQIVEAHGGEIDVISQGGQGSTFWFTLPLYQGDKHDEPTRHPHSPISS